MKEKQKITKNRKTVKHVTKEGSREHVVQFEPEVDWINIKNELIRIGEW